MASLRVVRVGILASSAVALAMTAPALGAGADGEGGRVLLKPRAGAAHDVVLGLIAGERGYLRRTIPGIGVHVIELPEGADAFAAAQRLSRRTEVRFAEVDQAFAPEAADPNDPLYGSQWHLPKMGCAAAWDWSTGAGVTIAVLDTGVNASHEDLAGQLLPGWNFYDDTGDVSDVHGHGTKVTGVAGARTNNGVGVACCAPDAKILPIRVSDTSGYAWASTISEGLVWAADQGARVANLSFAGVAGSATITAAAEYVRGKGGVVVAGAGNSAGFVSTAENTSIISVSGTTSADLLWSGSSYGNYVDVSAPAQSIYTTTSGGGYNYGTGTSYAGPNACGVLALMIAAQPALSPQQYEQALEAAADDLGDPGYDMYYGFGRVNAARAVEAIRQVTPSADLTPPSVGIVSPSGGYQSGMVTVSINAADDVAVARVELLVDGQLLASETASPYDFAWDTTQGPDGARTLTARAADAAGNVGSSSPVTVTIANAPETQAPAVAWLSPADGESVSGTVRISVRATDNVAVAQLSLSIDGRLAASLAPEQPSATLTYDWNSRKAGSGTHALQAVATDLRGNTTTSSILVTVAAGSGGKGGGKGGGNK